MITGLALNMKQRAKQERTPENLKIIPEFRLLVPGYSHPYLGELDHNHQHSTTAD
jgi:hypothetical protein